jgi:hypothetical protein
VHDETKKMTPNISEDSRSIRRGKHDFRFLSWGAFQICARGDAGAPALVVCFIVNSRFRNCRVIRDKVRLRLSEPEMISWKSLALDHNIGYFKLYMWRG